MNDQQTRIRPHNDDPELVVIETRTYSGDADDIGELIDDDVVPRLKIMADAVTHAAAEELEKAILQSRASAVHHGR